MKKFKVAKSKVALIVACLLVLALSVTGCGSEKELTNIAEYDGCTLELTGGKVETTDTGETVLRVSATYTNSNSDPLYALCSFGIKAFQNDTEINDLSDINGSEAVLIKEVKNGKSLSVSYVFELTDESPVEVFVCTPTASEENIAKAIYLDSDQSSSEETN